VMEFRSWRELLRVAVSGFDLHFDHSTPYLCCFCSHPTQTRTYLLLQFAQNVLYHSHYLYLHVW
jgi:hypothetical protein